MKRRKYLLSCVAAGSLLIVAENGLWSANASSVCEDVTPVDAVVIIDPETPKRDGFVLTASEEFDDGVLNEKLFNTSYLPHWSEGNQSQARYEISNGTLKLKIEQDQMPWDPRYDGSTRVSSLQTFNRDYQHRWTSYPDLYRHVRPFYGHVQKYGYFEVRAKVAKGGGLHSAWWMTGAQMDQPEGADGRSRHSGEVDIFEILGRGETSEALTSTHTWGDFFGLWPTRSSFSDGSDYSAQWHTYGFDWTENHMDLYVNGRLVHHSIQSPDYPMLTYLGIYEKQEESSWTGPFDPDVPYPKVFEIDYFRAYQEQPKLPYSLKIADGIMQGQARADKDYVRWLGGVGNDVTLTHVFAPSDGFYNLTLTYRSGENRDLSIAVNHNNVLSFSDLNSGSFQGASKEVLFQADLKEGWNTVRFYSDTGFAPDLGFLSVENLSTEDER